MKIEDQVVSLELAKQMKEAGFPQNSLWWWVEGLRLDKDSDNYSSFSEVKDSKQEGRALFVRKSKKYGGILLDTEKERISTSAYTVAELGEILIPIKFCVPISYKLFGKWICSYLHIEERREVYKQKAKTEADARAQMALYIKKEGLI